MKKKGFTLIELLVTISILGIIMMLALPAINQLQSQNKTTKYQAYEKSMLSSAKLYIDSYTKDIFGNNTSGCYDIPYQEMVDANLLKGIQESGVSCSSDKTFVRVYKANDNYRYEQSIYCQKNSKKVYEENNLKFSTCENKADKEGPTISLSPNGTAYVKSTDITISIKDAYGLLENVEIKYGFTTNPNVTPSNLTTKKLNNKRGTIEAKHKVTTPSGVSGDYYLVVIPEKVRDIFGNWTSDKVVSKVYKLDNTKPTVPSATVRYDSASGTVRGNSSAWTNRTLWWGSYSAADSHSGIDHYEYSTNCTGSSSGTLNATSGHTYSSNTNYTFCIRSVDKVGNNSDWSSSYYFKVDKSAPAVPTSNTRYDSASGSIRGNSSAWTNRTLWWGNYNASDSGGSGINRYEYSQNCTGSSSGTLNAASGHTYSGDTNYTFCIRSVDNAGNASAWSGANYFKVDKSAPGCSSSGGNGSWTNGNRTLTGYCSDSLSGCQGNTSITFTGNTNTTSASPGTVYDNAGNATTCPGNQTVRIDKTAPSCSSSGGTGSWIRGGQNIVGTCSDNLSGCQGNTSKYFNYTTNQSVSPGVVYDNAGNATTCANQQVLVDNTGPKAPSYGGTSISSPWYSPSISKNTCWGAGGGQWDSSCWLDLSVSSWYGYTFSSTVNWAGDVGVGSLAYQQNTWTHNGGATDYCPNWFVGDCGLWREGDCRSCASWAQHQIRYVDGLGNPGNVLTLTYYNYWY